MIGLVTFLAVGLQTAPQSQVEDARDVKFDQLAPVVVIEVSRHPLSALETFSIYPYFAQAGGRRHLAARRAINMRGGQRVSWAVISECPGAQEVVLELERLPAPAIDIPGFGRDDEQGPGTDGGSFKLWSRGPTWPTAYGYEVAFESNFGSPLADWANRFKATLADCWQPDPPRTMGSS
ncbi:hypothetical protein [Brevundimonas sp.]|uniref:hypothetical protein n=1 Tax=Brevundimonas sp. TaxID=1871086 RepID=UPI0028AFE05A|nr:hypothetical protein [Brevundimonas sp.]